MVEKNASRQISMDAASLQYTVEEQFLAAKTGIEGIVKMPCTLDPTLLRSIDGTISKTPRRCDGQTGGRIAATVIRDAFALLPPEATRARQWIN